MIGGSSLDANPLPPLLQTALACWEGERGGREWIVDRKDGSKHTEFKLPSPPVHDGMAVSGGRLLVSAMDGSVSCFAEGK